MTARAIKAPDVMATSVGMLRGASIIRCSTLVMTGVSKASLLDAKVGRDTLRTAMALTVSSMGVRRSTRCR